ncbi:uncharacterized protein KY384_000012 [Bacidia gigantensis]|uniref:uncharacterized protein n=1 Tax=Bacidia gigantensis TaxID=2732470 RepID=UPI001D055B9C|nr:uncharacterized protein KY384_000012 [Bacidia gigantensis]KAG8526419.1 hypothetical protein KY384_000012 [Bacidia gigantensis]
MFVLYVVLASFISIAFCAQSVYLIQVPFHGTEFVGTDGETYTRTYVGISVEATDTLPGYTFDFVDIDVAAPGEYANWELDRTKTKARARRFPAGADGINQQRSLVLGPTGNAIVSYVGRTELKGEPDMVRFASTGSGTISGAFSEAIMQNPRMSWPISALEDLNDEHSMLQRFLKTLIPNPSPTDIPFLDVRTSALTYFQKATQRIQAAQTWKAKNARTYGRKVVLMAISKGQADATLYKITGAFRKEERARWEASLDIRRSPATYGGTSFEDPPGMGDPPPPYPDPRLNRQNYDRPRDIDSAYVCRGPGGGRPQQRRRDGRLLKRDVCSFPGDGTQRGTINGDIVTRAKLDGKTVSEVQTLKVSARAAGIGATGAAVVAAISFVVVDILDGNWVGAALGIVGLAALGAVAITELLAQTFPPLGFFVDIAISALMIALPGVFGEKKVAPKLTDPVGIIRLMFFGDEDITGNEGCQKVTDDNPNPDPNCVATYGKGVIEKIFDWLHSQAAFFMIACNGGFPMTIEIIAGCFTVIDSVADKSPTAIPGTTITCNTDNEDGDSITWSLKGDTTCKGVSKFDIDLTQITVPYLDTDANGTLIASTKLASDLTSLIATPGGQGGPCNIFSDVSGGYFIESLNRTLVGKPVSVACGPDTGAVGQRIDIAQPTPANQLFSTLSSGLPTDANAGTGSTSGDTVELGPTPQAPAPLTGYDETNGICFSNSRSTACLPNGTYDFHADLYVTPPRDPENDPFTMDSAEKVYGPPGAKLGIQFYHQEIALPVNSKDDLHKALLTDIGGGSLAPIDLVLPNPVVAAAPGACFWTKTKYSGTVACAKVPGAGDLPVPIQKKVNSVSLVGNANVQLFAGAYAGVGGENGTIPHVWRQYDVEDTSSIPVGADKDSYAAEIVSVSIFAGEKTDGPSA